jgi:hypothetical protein
MNRPITSQETEVAIKKSPNKEKYRNGWLHG